MCEVQSTCTFRCIRLPSESGVASLFARSMTAVDGPVAVSHLPMFWAWKVLESMNTLNAARHKRMGTLIFLVPNPQQKSVTKACSTPFTPMAIICNLPTAAFVQTLTHALLAGWYRNERASLRDGRDLPRDVPRALRRSYQQPNLQRQPKIENTEEVENKKSRLAQTRLNTMNKVACPGMLPLDEARGTDEPSMREQRTNKESQTGSSETSRTCLRAEGLRTRIGRASEQKCLRTYSIMPSGRGASRPCLRADASSDSSRGPSGGRVFGQQSRGPSGGRVFGQESIL